MDNNSSKEQKLAQATTEIEAQHEKQMCLLLQTMVARTGLHKFKKILLSQTMHCVFGKEERLQILNSDRVDGLLQICSNKFKWYDGIVIEKLFDYIRQENIEGTKDIQDEMWKQFCSYCKDPDRINIKLPSIVVFTLDIALREQLGEDSDKMRKFYNFCKGVLGQNVEFEGVHHEIFNQAIGVSQNGHTHNLDSNAFGQAVGVADQKDHTPEHKVLSPPTVGDDCGPGQRESSHSFSNDLHTPNPIIAY